MPLLDDIEEALEYLRTTIMVSERGPLVINTASSNSGAVEDGYIVTVTAANVAPKSSDYSGGPQVVFLGLNFLVRGSPAEKLPGSWWERAELVRSVGDRHRPGEEANPRQRTGGAQFPSITPAEQELGPYLFPGQAVSCIYTVPANVLSEVAFDVEATVSRRHLFHTKRTLHAT